MLSIPTLKGIKRKKVRVVFMDTVKGEIHSSIRFLGNQDIIIEDPEIIRNPQNFKYKYQVFEDKWENVSKYIKLVDMKELLNSFLFGKEQISIQPFHSLLEEWSTTTNETDYRDLGKLTYTVFRNLIWANVPSIRLNNVKSFALYVKTHFQNSSMLANVAYYLEQYIYLKERFEEENLNDFTIFQLEKVKPFLEEMLSRTNDLQLSYLLEGKIHSLLGDREIAAEKFEKALNCFPNYLPYLTFEEGVNTFTFGKEGNELNEITFISTHKPQTGTVFLISLDANFLRYYGTQLLFYISIFKKYHFHFHVVGNPLDVGRVIAETEALFNQIGSYRQNKSEVVAPSFSTETIPGFVSKHKTYFASSRYLQARKVMQHFNSDVLIMDADMFFETDPDSYLKAQKKADITLPFSKGIVNLCPWRRILAGNVYLKNNEHTKAFLMDVEKHTLENLTVEDSWMLDQNALLYAYEKAENIDIGERNFPNLPFVQKPLGRFAEER